MSSGFHVGWILDPPCQGVEVISQGPIDGEIMSLATTLNCSNIER